eukprot:6045356-Amphidinium_carterae.2
MDAQSPNCTTSSRSWFACSLVLVGLCRRRSPRRAGSSGSTWTTPLLSLFRKAAAAACTCWSLFPAACSPPHRVQDNLDPDRRWPKCFRAAGILPSAAEGTSSSARRFFCTRTWEWNGNRERLLQNPLRSRNYLAQSMNELMIIRTNVCPSMTTLMDHPDAVNAVFMVGTHA